VNEALQKIREDALARLAAAQNESDLESISVGVLGRSGSLTEILRTMGKLAKEERAKLVNAFKNMRLDIAALRSIDEAIITRGGVSVKEISPKTMESKRVSGLYFAGELMDVDAYTGGYDLQIAFSTGWLAGKNAAEIL